MKKIIFLVAIIQLFSAYITYAQRDCPVLPKVDTKEEKT